MRQQRRSSSRSSVGGGSMNRNNSSRLSYRRRRRRKQRLIKGILIGVIAIIAIIALYLLLSLFLPLPSPFKKDDLPVSGTVETTTEASTTEEETTEDALALERAEQEKRAALIVAADRLAASYDYDAAIAHIQTYEGFANHMELTDAIAGYEATKATLVAYKPEDVTHVFYHSLIVDTSLAFDGDSKAAGYNQVMTTVDEFNKITMQMYERGFVLVSMYDMGRMEVQEDGTEKMVPGTIWLPEGKKPYVLSQDDTSYYHYMDGDGFATRIVLDENGKPTCEYVQKDGTTITGDFDMIPLIDRFVEEHPDGSYRGAKGIIALTGYNGVLGYRTDIAYKTGEGLDIYQKAWLDAHPDYDWDEERAEATRIANALKEDGWLFASHSWGHRYYGQISEETLHTDAQKWEDYVEPLLGETDILIFAFGDDIGSWRPYTEDNTRYTYLRSLGFHYFCNVDSNERWVQVGKDFIRQGRRNLDGTRMWLCLSGQQDRVADLFDVATVFDPARPTPVE